jgi:Protein of unknown function (DUF2934)
LIFRLEAAGVWLALSAGLSVFETEGWNFKPLRARQLFTAAQMTLCRIAQSTIQEQFGASAGRLCRDRQPELGAGAGNWSSGPVVTMGSDFAGRHFERSPSMSAIEEMIRKRAYELWEQAGCPDGRSYEFWFAARTEIEAAQSPDGQEPRAKAARASDDRVVAAAAKGAVEKSSKAPASAKPKPRRS